MNDYMNGWMNDLINEWIIEWNKMIHKTNEWMGITFIYLPSQMWKEQVLHGEYYSRCWHEYEHSFTC